VNKETKIKLLNAGCLSIAEFIVINPLPVFDESLFILREDRPYWRKQKRGKGNKKRHI
jgi:hypothetical protein